MMIAPFILSLSITNAVYFFGAVLLSEMIKILLFLSLDGAYLIRDN